MHNKNERFLTFVPVDDLYRGVIIKLVPGNTERTVFEQNYRLIRSRELIFRIYEGVTDRAIDGTVDVIVYRSQL